MKASSVRVLLVIVPLAASARAQTIDDGLLMPSGALGTGSFYAHESWSQYWEGTLKRDNGNIGTLTTQSVTWVAGYGVTDRLSVMALLPRSEEHTSELQSLTNLVCRLLLEKK